VNIHFTALNVQFRQSLQHINVSQHITFVHGPISTGKSTIARLIDYCLGGGLQRTPALNQEFVSAQLAVTIGENEVLLEREGLESSSVRVTWRNKAGVGAAVLAPTEAGDAPVWGDAVFNLSDLLFFLAGVQPIKVRRSKRDPDSKLVRLSFRDLMWYCYLDQDHLDSSFFRLEDDSRKWKSRDVMRFVVGYYTEYMNELEIELEEKTDERRAKEEAATQIRAFLEELGYGSALDIGAQIKQTEADLLDGRRVLQQLREQHRAGTHFADQLRDRLSKLASQVESEKQILGDLEGRISDQEQLRAELVTSKFKLSRAQAANVVLSGVEFELCPSCGAPTARLNRNEGECILCGTDTSTIVAEDAVRPEVLNRDLDTRIEDVEMSLKQHRRQLRGQERRVAMLIDEKIALDTRLSDELATYDSAFLANARDAERHVGSLGEKLRNLQRIARMPEALDRLQKEIASLIARERSIRAQITAEKKKLSTADSIVAELEDTYLAILLNVGVPGIEPSDRIAIDRRSWVPTICPNGNKDLGYDFYSAGSGGKKTLLNVCYALAVHKVAAAHELPLPTFLIIDSPMKNIGKDVNKETFLALYDQLYALAAADLKDTQFLIIDNEFAPAPRGIEIEERRLTLNDPKAPPLIPEYRGP